LKAFCLQDAIAAKRVVPNMTIDVTHVKAKALRLIGIANELLAMARQFEQDDNAPALVALTGRAERAPDLPHERDHPVWTEIAKQHYRNRRRRDKIFGTETLFGEPAWDILLDLFIAAKEGRRVSVMSACIGAAVPSTTALRWISALEREGLLLREDDADDARRTYVMLSPCGYEAMVEYFDTASRTLRPAVLLQLGERDRSPAAPPRIMPGADGEPPLQRRA